MLQPVTGEVPFKDKLHCFMSKQMGTEDGYSGVEVITRTEIIILAKRTQNIELRKRELTTLIQEQFNFPEGTVEVTWYS